MSLRVFQSRSFNLLRGDVSSAVKGENKTSKRFLSWQHAKSNSSSHLKLVALASTSSVSGSGAEYSEGLLDVRKKEKKKEVAGIDQDELVDPALLADPDSRFCEFKGVHVHHKVYDVASQGRDSMETASHARLPHIPMILLHGFGASVFSWNRVMKHLAGLTGSRILAFDRPAFGLTSRVKSVELSSRSKDEKPLNPYSMAFSVLATLYFIDFLASDRAILVGHSAGCLVAVNTYFEAPERVAALILVAPAILAPYFSRRGNKGSDLGRENKKEERSSGLDVAVNPFSRIFRFLSQTINAISEVLVQMVKGMGGMLSTLYKKLLSTFLRSAFAVMLVRMVIDKFGIAAIRNAWHDPNKINEHVLHGYTKPLRSKYWDRALLEYTTAMLLDADSESKPPLAERLHEISCPVLIVTGDNDRLVPSWNAERLSQAIPGSCLEVIKQCGHLPHEEKVEEFVSAVEKFLQRAFGGSQEQQILQAVS
ncbi:uncharacterized protein LOC115684856 [Syzygium oleosum]|uniref:uncharacterized protein LOC115684856 n=1 Tax=Syzygium oleosum TaxID=219896 RepID=UPI0011D27AAD|nr:uncharacterized protein LOC115684856 [Syzygium oleosum]